MAFRGLSCVWWRPWSFRKHRGQRTVLAFQPNIRGWHITQKVLALQTSSLACPGSFMCLIETLEFQKTQRSEASFSSCPILIIVRLEASFSFPAYYILHTALIGSYSTRSWYDIHHNFVSLFEEGRWAYEESVNFIFSSVF